MSRGTPGRGGDGSLHPSLQRVRQEGRWWWLQARHTQRIWRWAALAALLLFLLLAVLRKPLADWFWNTPQIDRLLLQGDRALREGRLSASDGTGARERYAAALALDADRSRAREGLARTGQAALDQAAQALAQGRLEQAVQALQLAELLQVPQAQRDALSAALRARQTAAAGVDQALQQGQQALAEGRLAGSDDAALPLLQRVLQHRPDDMAALEARDDALADLLARSRLASSRNELPAAATALEQARGFDAGHADLPQTQGEFNRAFEHELQQVQRDLDRQRLDAAVTRLQPLLQVQVTPPIEAALSTLREQLVNALLRDARRLETNARADAAARRLAQAQASGASAPALAQAREELQRLRSAEQGAPRQLLSTAQREREVRRLLQAIIAAEAAGRFITPPGDSAFDALREVQTLAPQDRRVLAAARRMTPASRRCFEDALRQNRVQAAGACLQAWQTLAPGDSALGAARARLAQRWVAIGSERLGAGDLAFAETAARQAAQWQPGMAELAAFEQRLQQVRGGEH